MFKKTHPHNPIAKEENELKTQLLYLVNVAEKSSH